MKRSLLCAIGLLLVAGAAFGDDSTETTIADLKENAETFQLKLDYFGPSGKPYYTLHLSVPPIKAPADSPFDQQANIEERDAEAIIDHLASHKFFDRATDRLDVKKRPSVGYLLTVSASEIELAEILGWDLSLFARLDGLQSTLTGDAASAMKRLQARLSGHRKAWSVVNPK
ncbi:MAG: hypothetical protein NXI22_17815 [bacterium]|nr:hypothetical protein [bacterium]